jgi:GAF domain-containing protein
MAHIPERHTVARAEAEAGREDELMTPREANADLLAEITALRERLASLTRENTELQEQQTATGEILGIISRSPADARPVFDAIAVNALRLCDAQGAVVVRYDGELLHVVAHHNVNPEAVDRLKGRYPLAPDRHNPMGRAVLDGVVVQVRDLQATEEFSGSVARQFGARGHVSIPLLHQDRAIGAIGISRPTLGPFSDRQIELLKTFADQAVIAIENARLFNETKEALDQQTATAEILRVISQSPTDVQPVFDAIVAAGRRLSGGLSCTLRLLDGEVFRLAAFTSTGHIGDEAMRSAPPTSAGEPLVARVMRTGAPVFVSDTEIDPLADAFRERARARGFRSVINVPLLRQGHVMGVMNVTRQEPGIFAPPEIALLETFADQAVIAIENVRLFTELQEKNTALTQAHAQVTESLEQRTATAEILRVISSSPTDVQPVFAAIVRSAVRLCGGTISTLYRYDGHLIHFEVTSHPSGIPQAITRGQFPRPADASSLIGRAIVERAVVNVADMGTDPRANPGIGRVAARERGFRSMVIVPMFRENQVIGIITVGRADPGEFSDSDIALLKTFADQAVIAIENVRLFTELEARNRELTTALDTQTATSDILRVISQSQTDVQPVFDAIVGSAVRLLTGSSGGLTRVAGDQIALVALMSTDDAGDAALRAFYPRPLQSAQGMHGLVIRDRAPLNVADAHTDPRLSEAAQTIARARGVRSQVAVPLLRRDEAIGALAVNRREPGGFTDDEIALLQTFADQAVIAIENVRLFTELQEKNRALTEAHAQVTESLEQQTATSELLKVIGRSTFDLQPVFQTLAENAVRLCEAGNAAIFRFDGQVLRIAAAHNDSGDVSPVERELLERYPISLGRHSGAARAALERRTIHIHDIHSDPDYTWRTLRAPEPIRTVLALPILRANELLGAIVIYRREVRPFTDSHIALMETFADQAAIAIENVRLFTELRARTQELTRSVGQLTALGEVGRAVSSTLDLETVLTTIVSRAVQLSGLDGGVVFEYDEAAEEFLQRVATETGGTLAEVRRTARFRKGEGVLGRTALTLEPVQVPDITIPGAYESRLRENLIESGIRAILAVPMVREDRLIGCLAVTRNHPGEFPSETIELLRTFATQSALAIQNARLFREIEEKSRQLEVASQHKSEFLANMSHELRTPLNAIIGFSEVLSDRMFGELNEKQEEYLKDIYASGTHLLSLINDILDLSKIEAGRMELELTDFHLPTALDNALTLVRERAGRRSITLQMSADEQLGEVRADERKIRQVVLNLLSNAIKFTPEGGRIEVAAVTKDGSMEVTVSDTGVGIAPEDQEAVFEEFRQVGTADKKAEGTGLGLTLCRKFIELHGGRIWVTSQVGVGSTFTFTIPVRRDG